MSEIIYRPVVAADAPFLFDVYACTRQEEMGAIPWSAAQKQAFLHMQADGLNAHVQEHYPAAEHQVILQDGVPVGRLWLHRSPDRTHLIDLTVLPGHRGRGIGSVVLQQVLDQNGDRPLTLYVESFNPALPFLERLGFATEAAQGMHVLLRWTPEHRKGDRHGTTLHR